MTGIPALLVVQQSDISNKGPVYEADWLLLNYVDTSAVRTTDGSNLRGAGIILDALLGDGSTRYGFLTARPVTLAYYDGVSRSVNALSTRKHPKNRYLLKRSGLLEACRGIAEEREMFSFYAMTLPEFRKLVEAIPRIDLEQTTECGFFAKHAFLMALEPEGRLVIPLFVRDAVPALHGAVGFCGGILHGPSVSVPYRAA